MFTNMSIISLIISVLVYIIGYFIAFWMLITEIKADGEKITIGDKTASILFSLFSFLCVIVLLVRGWSDNIGRNGYWNTEINKEKEPIVLEVNNVTK